MTLRDLFARNFKYYRKQAKVSQMRLAELCDTSSNYIGEIETGKKFPSPEMMEKIASVLGVSAWCLLYDKEILPLFDCGQGTFSDRLSPEKKERLSGDLLSELGAKIQEIISRY